MLAIYQGLFLLLRVRLLKIGGLQGQPIFGSIIINFEGQVRKFGYLFERIKGTSFPPPVFQIQSKFNFKTFLVFSFISALWPSIPIILLEILPLLFTLLQYSCGFS